MRTRAARFRLRRPAALLSLPAVVAACTAAPGGPPAHRDAPTVFSAPESPPAAPPPVLPSSPSSSAPASSSAASSAPASTANLTSTPPPAPAPDPAHRALAAMTLAQRVGQLFMVGASSTGVDQAAMQALTDHDVGSVILTGTSQLSVSATAQLTARLQRGAPPGVGLIITTDQEGGQVQRLRGPGFGSIPTAVQQSEESVGQLQQDTAAWAGALRRAGLNVDLAPVADTVPPAVTNPPIGLLNREYGATPGQTTADVLAVVRGLGDAGVAATVKHFPGLGRVSGNTDYAGGVVDDVTVAGDPLLQPFAAAIQAGVRFVMVSTAIYQRIDPGRPAAYSAPVIESMLRTDLHFDGVVVSDDLGKAKQVSDLEPAQRALNFLAAGGDLVLTVVASQIPAMTAAVIARAEITPDFQALVDAAALRVLEAKAQLGLLR